jgi:predicted kinase
MLYIFGGLPGTGKTTLSTALARYCNGLHLRIDTIEQAMRASGLIVDGPAGYMVGYALALDNLRLGRSVVADSVNPLGITRRAWIDVAVQAGAPFTEIEVICSDQGEHRRRVELRQSDVAGLRLPLWNEVMGREYDEWNTKHIVIDTAGQTPDQSTAFLLDVLKVTAKSK